MMLRLIRLVGLVFGLMGMFCLSLTGCDEGAGQVLDPYSVYFVIDMSDASQVPSVGMAYLLDGELHGSGGVVNASEGQPLGRTPLYYGLREQDFTDIDPVGRDVTLSVTVTDLAGRTCEAGSYTCVFAYGDVHYLRLVPEGDGYALRETD